MASPDIGLIEGFPGDVAGIAEAPASMLFSLSDQERVRLQIEGAQASFSSLRPHIPALAQLARDQHVDTIGGYDDLAKLLFSHHIYKSYPLRIIEKGDYAKLTKWLDGVTSYDLSGVDTDNCVSLDHWNEEIERQTPLRVHIAPGPSGKLGITPRDVLETDLQVHGYFIWPHQGISGEQNSDLRANHLSKIPILFLNYRHGPHQQRIVDALVRRAYAGNEDMVFALNPGRMSIDVMALAGRLKAADERGSKLAISASLHSRRTEFLEAERNRSGQVEAFFERIISSLAEKRILFFGSWTSLMEGEKEATKLGLSRIFASNSLITTGGGYAGAGFTAGWHERLTEFLGVENLHDSYGSAEQMLPAQICPADHYHPHPLTICFLLDPETGAVLPRSGMWTGRFAFYNLAARSAWGGFVTGDEVTMSWDSPCPCGRSGPFLHRAIRPYSAAQGGEDKISCAGMPTAHRAALDYLRQL